MPKTVQVLADLTLENSRGAIRIANDEKGNLIVHCPNEDTFFGLQEIRWPFQSGWKSLVRINRTFYENRQPVTVKVDGRTWMTLGRSPRPGINYWKVAPRYISRTSLLKNSLYVIGIGLGATLLYALFRRRD